MVLSCTAQGSDVKGMTFELLQIMICTDRNHFYYPHRRIEIKVTLNFTIHFYFMIQCGIEASSDLTRFQDYYYKRQFGKT